MQDIQAWLKEPDYPSGVQLYHRYGSSSFLKGRFAAGHSPYNETKLIAELKQLLANTAATTSAPPTPVAIAAHPKSNDKHRYLQLLKRKERLYRELNDLMARRQYLPEGDALRDCALELLSKHQQLIETWSLIDHYQEHSSFPAEEKERPANEDPEKRIQLLRQAISRAKARLNAPNCRNRQKTEATMAGHQAVLQALLAKRGSDE